MNQVPRKLTSSIAFLKSSRSGLPMNLINTPMSRVSCRNDENPENQADQFRAFFSQKRGVNQVPRKITSSIAFFKSLQSGLPMNLLNTPMPRVSCPNDENPEGHFVKNALAFGSSDTLYFLLQYFIL